MLHNAVMDTHPGAHVSESCWPRWCVWHNCVACAVQPHHISATLLARLAPSIMPLSMPWHSLFFASLPHAEYVCAHLHAGTNLECRSCSSLMRHAYLLMGQSSRCRCILQTFDALMRTGHTVSRNAATAVTGKSGAHAASTRQAGHCIISSV